MKMVKSLLLGSAAGLVAVAGAQAADLPVKAKPVEYVKICSLYGAGYYYVPGTDVCLKVGGYVRAEYSYAYGTSMTTGPFATPNIYNSRSDGNDLLLRTRAYITTESRQQTAYGTLRTLLNVGVNFDSPATSSAGFNANRAFIQIAGFTVGLATSYYDFYAAAATSYLQLPSSDTGDGGWKVFAYTAQFGNGLSATLSLEEPRRTVITNASLAAGVTGALPPGGGTLPVFGTPQGGLAHNCATSAPNDCVAVPNASFNDPLLVGALPTNNYAKIRWPDIVANLRVDQAWGSAQVMGAVHDASGGYYGTALGNWNNGHPGDKVGWAVGAGIKINFPMIGPGDYFQAQVNYTQGAMRYVGNTQPGSFSPASFAGNELALGYVMDGIFCGGQGGSSTGCPSGMGASGVELTTAWGVNAAYEHFWTPSLRTSVYGSYMSVQYNNNAKQMISTATCNSFPISGGNVVTGVSAPAGSLTGMSNCDPNWSWWGVGSRTQWNVTKDFYMGVDVYYTRLNTAFEGYANYRASANTGAPSGTYTIKDQDVVGTRVRFHRDINP